MGGRVGRKMKRACSWVIGMVSSSVSSSVIWNLITLLCNSYAERLNKSICMFVQNSKSLTKGLIDCF